MNDNSFTHGSRSRIPSDERMDSLLHDFFHLEIPVELNQPFRDVHGSGVSRVTLSVEPAQRGIHMRPRSVRFAAIAAAVASLGLAVAVIISGSNSPPAGNGTAASSLPDDPSTPKNIEQLMLVSPQGDSGKSMKIVGPDGVTLEETDSIELHPRK